MFNEINHTICRFKIGRFSIPYNPIKFAIGLIVFWVSNVVFVISMVNSGHVHTIRVIYSLVGVLTIIGYLVFAFSLHRRYRGQWKKMLNITFRIH